MLWSLVGLLIIVGLALAILPMDASIRRMLIIVVGVIVIAGLAYTLMGYAHTAPGPLP